jgi:tyrosyl-tRNA synthetase
MSKSFGNYIGIEEPPDEMFGKVMSIDDRTMVRYYELLTTEPLDPIRSAHPMDAKLRLAALLVERYHGPDAATRARELFDRRVRKREFAEVEEIDLRAIGDAAAADVALVDAIHQAGLAASKSEVRRLIPQGAVDVDDAPVTDVAHRLARGHVYRIRVGKRRLARISL